MWSRGCAQQGKLEPVKYSKLRRDVVTCWNVSPARGRNIVFGRDTFIYDTIQQLAKVSKRCDRFLVMRWPTIMFLTNLKCTSDNDANLTWKTPGKNWSLAM